MTQTFGADENNDLYIGDDGNLVIVSGLEAVKQSCESAVKAQRGEMIYASTSGLPNFQAVWVGVPNIGQFRAALRQVLIEVDGVNSVNSIVIGQKGNTLIYQAVISTAYGNSSINGQLQS